VTSQCANPACGVPFRYFRSGKIFILEAPYVGQRSALAQLKRRIEYFWLCGGCSSAMTLVANMDGSPRLVPCEPLPTAGASDVHAWGREVFSAKPGLAEARRGPEQKVA
jgi:hypothetical protein